MRRTLLVLLALGSVAATDPVTVWTPQQLACPAKRAPAKLAADLARDLRSPQGWVNVVTRDAITTLGYDCAARTKVPTERETAYRRFVFYRIAVNGLADDVRTAGIDPATVDAVMDVGTNRANPSFAKFDNAMASKLVTGLQAKGVDVKKVPQTAFRAIVLYLDTASTFWRELAPVRTVP